MHQQIQRWIKAGRSKELANDLRAVLQVATVGPSKPTAVIMDSRTVQSTPTSGARGYYGAKRRKRAKVHAVVSLLGHLLALRTTAANEQDRAEVGALAAEVQATTCEHIKLAYVDQGYTRN